MEANVQKPLKVKFVFRGQAPQAPPPHTCSLCARTFSSANALHGHMRCHRLPPSATTLHMPSAPVDHASRLQPLPFGWARTAKRTLVPVERDPKVFDEIEDGKEKDAAEDQATSEISTNNAGAVAAKQEEVGALEGCGETCEPSEARACDCDCCRRRRYPPCAAAAPETYACVPCGKAFASVQALCGHMASHRKLHSHPRDGSPLEWSFSKPSKRRRGREENPAEHRCDVCGRVFPTGQALGGHKRLHWEGPKTFPTLLPLPPATATPGEMENTSAMVHDFDLNETPVVEEGAKGDPQELLLLV